MNKSRKNGFTLIEMLMVISIMALLMGMMGLGTGAAIEAARKTKARAETAELVRAWKSYWKTYGKWPDGFTDNSGTPSEIEMTAPRMAILSGYNPENLKGIPFIDMASSSSRGMLDPWDKPYVMYFNRKANDDEEEYYQTSVFFPATKGYLYETEY